MGELRERNVEDQVQLMFALGFEYVSPPIDCTYPPQLLPKHDALVSGCRPHDVADPWLPCSWRPSFPQIISSSVFTAHSD
jgi:hypothetical protein